MNKNLLMGGILAGAAIFMYVAIMFKVSMN
jgi:hypothetical protein